MTDPNYSEQAMNEKPGVERAGALLVQKMFELEEAYREIERKEEELGHYKKMSNDQYKEMGKLDYKDKEIAKLQYTVSKLEEKIKSNRGESEMAKRDRKNEQDKRKELQRRITELETENKSLRAKVGALRVKLGVSNANYNVGRYDTDQLRKTHQEGQIQIARLEERLAAANQELQRLRDPEQVDGSPEQQKKLLTNKKELQRARAELERMKDFRRNDLDRLHQREDDVQQLQIQNATLRERLSNLQTVLENEQVKLDTERSIRQELERQNEDFRTERQLFDETLRSYKVKLGVSQAGRNVNLRQAEELRKRDEDYKNNINRLQKKLKMAQVEIDRLRNKTTVMPGKTASSVQTHVTRFMVQRDEKGVDHTTPLHTTRSLPRQLPSIGNGPEGQQKRQPFTKAKPPNTS